MYSAMLRPGQGSRWGAIGAARLKVGADRLSRNISKPTSEHKNEQEGHGLTEASLTRSRWQDTSGRGKSSWVVTRQRFLPNHGTWVGTSSRASSNCGTRVGTFGRKASWGIMRGVVVEGDAPVDFLSR